MTDLDAAAGGADAQRSGTEVLAALTPLITNGTLGIASGSLDGDLDSVLTQWFGGKLVAAVGTPSVGANAVTYSAAGLATAGFALPTTTATVSADLTVSSDPSGHYQLAVAATMPAGYQLADSFPAIAGTRLTELVGEGVGIQLSSTATTATLTWTLAATDTSFGPAGWLLPSPLVLTGSLSLSGQGATALPVLELSSPTRSVGVGTFTVSASGGLTTRVVTLDSSPVLAVIVELVADLTAGGLTVPIAVDLFPGQDRLAVRLDTRRQPPAISSLGALGGFAAGANPQSLLSTDTPIGTLSLDQLSCTIDLATHEVNDITIAVGLGTRWPIVPGKFELVGLGVSVTIPNAYQPSQVSVTGVAGLQIGSGTVDAYVIYPDKVVGVTLEPGTTIELSSLLTTVADGTQLPGTQDSLAITALDAYADIAQQDYSLTVELDGTLTVISGFVIDQLTLAISYADQALQSFGFGALFTVAGVELALSAGYAASSWTLAGGTYADASIDIAALVADLGTMFGLRLPADLPSIRLSDLSLNYTTGTGAYAFTGTVTYLDPQGLLSKVTGTLKISSPGDSSWQGSVAGVAVIGTSTFTASYDFGTAQTVSFSWQLPEHGTPFGIAALCTLLGVGAPAIPAGLDLGLDQAAFSYTRGTGAVLLDAHSTNYGSAVFQTEPIGKDRVFAFGVDVPLNVTLADIPLVGDKIPGADQLGIADLGVWLVSRPLLQSEAETLNKANTTKPPYPRLPDAAVPGTVTFFGNLLLGTTSIPLSLPLGAATAQQRLALADTTGDTAADAIELAAAPAPPGGQDNTKWIAVQRTFGIFTFDRIGIDYETDGSNTLFFVLDASIALGPVTLSMMGLAVGSPLTAWDPTFKLQGLGISYDVPPLSIEGALYALPADQLSKEGVAFQYDGVAVVKAAQFTLAAVGSYAQLASGDPSLFLFAQLRTPLGGPPAFFVTGLMGGFGVNRTLALPTQDQVLDFPLLALAAPTTPNQPAPAGDPTKVLGMLEGTVAGPDGTKQAWIAPQAGSYWFAVGLEFTSFEIVDTQALLIAEFGAEFALALLGLSTLRLPQSAPAAETYAFVQLELAAVFKPATGFFGLTAVLAPSSYVIAPAAKLTGGFAFYVWFGTNPNAGQFVITLGGYHPAFKPPPGFPVEPRLGFAWAISDVVSIKGNAYFALTTSAVMAGGGLEIVYASGGLRAWFTAQADLLVSWRPFSFSASIQVSIGVSYTLDLFGVAKTLTLSLGASVSLWGPPTGGTATVHLWIVSFTVDFGAPQGSQSNQPLTPAEFAPLLPGAPVTVAVTAGLSAAVDDSQTAGQQRWLVRPGGFAFSTTSAVPATALAYGDGESATSATVSPTGFGLQVRPMNLDTATATHTVLIQNTSDGSWIDLTSWSPRPNTGSVPASLWGKPLTDANGTFTQLPPPSADLVGGAPVGTLCVLPEPTYGSSVGPVSLATVAFEPVTLPGGIGPDAPLQVGEPTEARFLPSFSATSVGAVSGIAGVTARTSLCTALAQATLFTGGSDSMAAFGAAATSEFTDPPLLAGARS